MTIITKPVSSGKKIETLDQPLVDNEFLPNAPRSDVESQDSRSYLHLQVRARRVSATTTVCLLLAALIVVGMGITTGTYLYQKYLRSQIGKFHGWCTVPYSSEPVQAFQQSSDSDAEPFDDNNIDEITKLMKDFFQEGIELDLEEEKYEKIEVPDFRDGRSGRFIHDFSNNLTGIIDITGRRCFVMPLNRKNVLPPRSMFDLLQKMWEGYYRVDTQVVRQTMKVVTPALNDTKEIGTYIGGECKGLPVYKLENYVGGVVKRSADLHTEAKFAQFSGRGITEYDIMNLEEVQEYEKSGVQ